MNGGLRSIPPSGGAHHVETLANLQRRVEELEESVARLKNLAKDQSAVLTQVQIDQSANRTTNRALMFATLLVVAACMLLADWAYPK